MTFGEMAQARLPALLAFAMLLTGQRELARSTPGDLPRLRRVKLGP